MVATEGGMQAVPLDYVRTQIFGADLGSLQLGANTPLFIIKQPGHLHVPPWGAMAT